MIVKLRNESKCSGLSNQFIRTEYVDSFRIWELDSEITFRDSDLFVVNFRRSGQSIGSAYIYGRDRAEEYARKLFELGEDPKNNW